ncbi:hypothetical protein [Flavobacterium davisii]|nr:hypothetical protein [Flavobacterium davisii]
MKAQLKYVMYSDNNQKLEGLLAQPKKEVKNKAGVLLLPAWMGMDGH